MNYIELSDEGAQVVPLQKIIDDVTSKPNGENLFRYLLKNESGAWVARGISRLLSIRGTEGEAAIHMEPIYSASASRGVKRVVFTRMWEKAESMGLPLYVSLRAQDEGGAEREVDVPDGFKLVPARVVLESRASRAPKVYVDSAGGEKRLGRFMLRGLLEVRKV